MLSPELLTLYRSHADEDDSGFYSIHAVRDLFDHIDAQAERVRAADERVLALEDHVRGLESELREMAQVTGAMWHERAEAAEAAVEELAAALVDCRPLPADLRAALARIAAMIAAGDRLAEGHTAHDDDCPFPYAIVATDDDCTCGLNAARDAWEQAKEGQDG